MTDLIIRDEAPEDLAAIYAVTRDAFAGKPYADGDEQDVVDRLRAQGALTESLVALRAGELVGHAAFSPAEVANESPWFALGPISVRPDCQGQRIGERLIGVGLDRLQQRGAGGCILTGDPNYYQRFGFVVTPALCPDNEPGEYFQVRLLAGPLPTSRFRFHPAFYE